MLKKKYLLLILGVVLSATITASALLYYLVTLPATLVSLNSAILVTDLADNPISDLGSVSLFIGEEESIFFKISNNYDDQVTLTFDVIIGGSGFSMVDGELGVNVDGGGYVGLLLGDPLILPLGSYVEVGLAIGHTETAVDPTLEVTVLAE